MNKKEAKKNVYLKMGVAVLLSLTLALGAIASWSMDGEWFQSSLVIAVALILLIGFVVFGYRQLKNVGKGLPTEDELSRKIMNLAASKSFYISIYWLLAIMWFEEPLVARGLDVSSAIGLGIAGMAVIFLLSWLYTSRKGKLD